MDSAFKEKKGGGCQEEHNPPQEDILIIGTEEKEHGSFPTNLTRVNQRCIKIADDKKTR